jgi:two-component system cell cycle response regulator DivK
MHPKSPPEEPAGQGRMSGDSPRAVLVVEDNVSNFQLVARMLEALGMRCEWKTSGYEVLEYAEALPRVDMVLMDIRLPYEGGFEAAAKLRRSQRFASVPIVGISAVASSEQVERAKSAGFNGFLGKPLDPDRFPDQIRRVMAGEKVWELG